MKKHTTLLFLAIGFGFCACTAQSTSINDAHNAYFQMDHKKAYTIFSNVINDKSNSSDDRAAAYLYAAKMQWMFYQNIDSAYALIKEGLTLDRDKIKLYLLKARISNDLERFDEAIDACNNALEFVESESDFYSVEFAFCSTLFKKHQQLALKNPSAFDFQSEQLLEGYTRLKKLTEPRPGDVKLSNLLLGYSILTANNEYFFGGWMSYFRLTQTNQVHPSLIKNITGFQEATNSFSLASSVENKETLILGLAESGFYRYAVLMHKLYFDEAPSTDPFIQEILLYGEFIEAIEVTTISFYQSIVNDGNRSNRERGEIYVDQISPHAIKLWNSLSWEGERPAFTKEGFQNELRLRFKSIINPFSANGYFGLQMGHIILNDKRTIEQYGDAAEFNYIAVDHMVSNGYSGWFWDGLAQTGGWADDEGFLQVRSAYTSGPVNKWSALTDSVLIKEWKEDLRQYEVEDDSIARKNPYAYLRGLAIRIERTQEQMILDSLKNKGLTGSQLRLAFINKIEFLNLESSIYAHEGRHVIDKKNNFSRKSEELEYTAKLSEIYFSSKPMMAISAIISRNIGDKTSHGQANLRVIKGLVKWMKKNKNDIAEFDDARPILPQLDKLSDSQLKQAVYSLDPMAKR